MKNIKEIFASKLNSRKAIQTFASFALIMILTLSSAFAITGNLANVHAQNEFINPTYAFIAAEPNPVGVNQNVLVNVWLADPTPTSAGGHGGDMYSNFTVTVTAPDGTIQTEGPFTASNEASAYFWFTPTQTGNYNLVFNYPGQTFSDLNLTYAASTATCVLAVQQQPVQGVQTNLPTGYWTYPINAMNYAWGSVSSNWLMMQWNSTTSDSGNPCAYDPEGTAPSTAHVLWTKPLTFGGLAGGQFGNVQYSDGRSYEEFFKPPVIISNHLYYNSIGAEEPLHQDINASSVICVDLSTGQTLFTIPNAEISFGQIYNYVSPNQAGAFAYLWSSPGQPGRSGINGGTWKMYDAWTGEYILSISNVPSGVPVYGSDGSLLVYSLAYNKTAETYQLTLWNSTIAIQPTIDTTWTWRPYTYAGQTIDGSNGIEWVVNEPNVTGQAMSNFQQAGFFDGNAILTEITATGSTAWTNTTGDSTVQFMAYDMTNGAFLWNSTIYPPPNLPNDLNGIDSFELEFVYSGHFYSYIKQTLQWVAYDIRTGQVLWTTEPYSNPFDSFNQGGGDLDVNGVYYAANFIGNIVAYNDTTGNQLWTYDIGNSGLLTPYGSWPLYNGITLVDNNLFITTGEHGNGVEPLYQGEAIYDLNVATGKLIWSMEGWFQEPAIANGILVSANCYDNQIYAFGKGPSATTVTATAGLGNAVTIQGTVTDQSAGAKQLVQNSLFNIVPAVSDDSMSAYMTYLYEQQPLPTNTTGVPITLTITDSNGALVSTINTQTDINGHYGVSWTPSTTGTYTITAVFPGTNSYYSSTQETTIAVGTQATTTPSASITPTNTPTQTPTPTATETGTSSPLPTASTSPSAAVQPPASSSSVMTYIIIAAVVVVIAIISTAIVLQRRK
jgi:hypothetical protein